MSLVQDVYLRMLFMEMLKDKEIKGIGLISSKKDAILPVFSGKESTVALEVDDFKPIAEINSIFKEIKPETLAEAKESETPFPVNTAELLNHAI